MNVLVLYDSAYGNTAKVAEAIEHQMERHSRARMRTIDNASLAELRAADMVLVGSPTQGGNPTSKLKEFLDALPQDIFKGKLVAAFDTRFDVRIQKLYLRLLMRMIGYASPRINTQLLAKGGTAASAPAGFIVQDKEGPLQPGEIERAATWADGLLSAKTAPVGT